MKNRIDMRLKDLEITRQILMKHISPDANVWVFGSRSKGNARPFSDLDLMIDFNGQPLPLAIMTKLLDDFEESDLPYKVDIVDWNTVNDDFHTLTRKDRIKLNFTKTQ